MTFVRLAILCFPLFLVSCASTYSIDGEYPSPLVEPIPVYLELHLDSDFVNYVYEDDREESDVTIELGSAQQVLFETITDAMFTGNEPAPTLMMTPSIDEFQYAVPRQTSSQIYEVWIKYRVLIQEADGNPVADWIITGYGKTPTALLKRPGTAINAATNIALRDIGTQLSIGFKRQPDIALWLSNNVEASPL